MSELVYMLVASKLTAQLLDALNFPVGQVSSNKHLILSGLRSQLFRKL